MDMAKNVSIDSDECVSPVVSSQALTPSQYKRFVLLTLEIPADGW